MISSKDFYIFLGGALFSLHSVDMATSKYLKCCYASMRKYLNHVTTNPALVCAPRSPTIQIIIQMIMTIKNLIFHKKALMVNSSWEELKFPALLEGVVMNCFNS